LSWTDAPQSGELYDLIALTLVPGIGPARIRALQDRFGSASDIRRQDAADLSRVPSIGSKLAGEIVCGRRDNEIRRQLSVAAALKARPVGLNGSDYPSLLREIYDPPPLLWTRGSGRVDWTRCVSIVGTRRATPYGRRCTELLAGALARRGFTIVSGLAYGIDAAAHRAAFEAGGATVAVFGSGLDIVYPAIHRGLAERIVRAGLIVSEFPFGCRPERTNFPRRNRLISGLSLGVIIVEAFEKGGALITAKLALDQNREVFAVPGPLSSAASEGPNRLIRDGAAKLVTGVDDVLDEIIPGPRGLEHLPAASPVPEMTEPERVLVKHLGREPEELDVICSRVSEDVSTVLGTLLTMELKGIVRQYPGKRFCLSGGTSFERIE
jgi:DNA processing protein